MTVAVRLDVDFSGPFFTGATARAIDRALKDTLKDVTDRGVMITSRQLVPGHGFEFGTLRRSIAGEVVNSRQMLVKTNVIYGAWIEGVSDRNRTTRFKGYHMFRKAAQALERGWPNILKRHLRRRMR